MSKAARALRLALNNSSKEEATTAFRQAFSYAEREGVRLSDLHVIREEAAGISPDRERELVDKYNAALKRAKELREELKTAEHAATHWEEMYRYSAAQKGTDGEAAEKLRKLKAYVKRL